MTWLEDIGKKWSSVWAIIGPRFEHEVHRKCESPVRENSNYNILLPMLRFFVADFRRGRWGWKEETDSINEYSTLLRNVEWQESWNFSRLRFVRWQQCVRMEGYECITMVECDRRSACGHALCGNRFEITRATLERFKIKKVRCLALHVNETRRLLPGYSNKTNRVVVRKHLKRYDAGVNRS